MDGAAAAHLGCEQITLSLVPWPSSALRESCIIDVLHTLLCNFILTWRTPFRVSNL